MRKFTRDEYKNILNRTKKTAYKDHFKQIYGKKDVAFNKNDVIVFCIYDNPDVELKLFLDYYFLLRIKHIIIYFEVYNKKYMDIIKEYDNITAIVSDKKINNKDKDIIKEFLLDKYAKDRWVMFFNNDEFFDFPYSNIIDLKDLIDYLNDYDFSFVLSYTLDVLPKDIEDKKAYLDLDSKKIVSLEGIKKIYYQFETERLKKESISMNVGGSREILFKIKECLTKRGLFLNKDYLGYIKFRRTGKIADFNGIIYRYRFFKDVEDNNLDKPLIKRSLKNMNAIYIKDQKILFKKKLFKISKNYCLFYNMIKEWVPFGE